jgi:hypothetical protein
MRALQWGAIVGGLAMLVGALIARNSASIPLLIIGSGWIVAGFFFGNRHGRLVNAMSFENGVLHLSSPIESLDIAPGDVVRIAYPWYDLQRMQALRISTVTRTIEAVPRFDYLADVLIALHESNSNIDLKM